MSTGATLKQIVTFRLGPDLFAADIFSVERVLRYGRPRSIPNVPEWIEGVIDYQARVVPVIDMRKRFELDDTGVSSATRLLILTVDGDFIGAVVDEVLEVLPLGAGKLSAPPAIFRGLSADFLLGLARKDERIIVVLDFARIFSTNERLALDKLREEETVV